MKQVLAFVVLVAAVGWLIAVVGRDMRMKSAAETREAQAAAPLGNPPKVGEVAPDFTLLEAHDAEKPERVTLSKVTADGPVVVVFYLSYQCERCVTHLKEIAGMKQAFTNAGLEVIAVSPDTPEATRAAIASLGDIDMPLLSDPEGKVAKSYGLVAAGDEQLHGIFIVGKDRRVAWEMVSEEPCRDYERILAEGRALQKGGVK